MITITICTILKVFLICLVSGILGAMGISIKDWQLFVIIFSMIGCYWCGELIGRNVKRASSTKISNNINEDDLEKNNTRILIDSSEFQSMILNYIGSDNIDKMFNNTRFASEKKSKDYKQAMIHGMLYASILTCKCNPIHIKEKMEDEQYDSNKNVRI